MRKLLILIALIFAFPLTTAAQSVDLLTQGEGYVSPFYKGRTLWSKEGRLTLLAVPQGLGSPNFLNYRWSRNGTVLGASSGIGKNTLSFSDTIFSKPVTILIEIVDSNSKVLADAETTLAPISPFLTVYESHPLYGYLFHRSIAGAYSMEGEEVTFTAFPYLFNTLRREATTLTYKWNGTLGESDITYRTPEEGDGTAEVNVALSHSESLIQTAQKSFLVNFGENEN